MGVRNFPYSVALDSGSFEVIKRYVAEGTGIGFLPEMVVQASDERLRIVRVDHDADETSLLGVDGAIAPRGGNSPGHRQDDGSCLQTYSLEFQRLDPILSSVTVKLVGLSGGRYSYPAHRESIHRMRPAGGQSAEAVQALQPVGPSSEVLRQEYEWTLPSERTAVALVSPGYWERVESLGELIIEIPTQ